MRDHQLGEALSAVLITDIVSESSLIDYCHILLVLKSGRQEPVAYVTAEARRPTARRFEEFADAFGVEPIPFSIFDDPKPCSHYLCTFVAGRHGNCGCSDDWADLEQFERAALELLPALLLETSFIE